MALTVGYLAQPTDELAYLSGGLNPKVERSSDGNLVFTFSQTERVVRRALGGRSGVAGCSTGCDEYITLEDGVEAIFSYTNIGLNCSLTIVADQRPWYRRAWSTLKRRFS